jgi:hypothetical protein
MEKISVGSIEMTWDTESRLASLWFKSETRATGADAAVLIGALTRWIGTAGVPFALLGDGAGLGGVDADYRAAFSRFFREHRENSYIAFFHMGPIIRIAADMFRIGTGVRLKAFADEESARAWLREVGIPA